MSSKGKAISSVVVITLLSKVLGFVRDMVLAYFFGASAVTDAYYVAQTIPEFLFSLVIQAISVGFIPIFLEILEKDGKEKAWAFVDNLSTIGIALVTVLVVVVYAFTDVLVGIFASGFDAETAAMAGMFIRISVWGVFFRLISAIDTAFLNANERFVVPSLTGVPLDIVTIASVALASFLNQPLLLAVGIAASYFFQMALQEPFVRKLKPRRKWGLSLRDPHVKKMVALVVPVALGVGANQINVLVDRTLASGFTGGISALNYANKVDNILENVVIMSLATVLFPSFSKYAARGELKALSGSLSKAVAATVLLMLPCSIAAFYYSEEVIRLLFGRGMFDEAAVSLTTQAMQAYSVGLLFLSVNAVLIRALYSLKKVAVVSACSCASMVFNAALSFALVGEFGIPGVAFATSVANAIQTVLLMAMLAREIGREWLTDGIRQHVCIIVASLVFTGLMLGMDYLLSFWFTPIVVCFISASVATVAYFALLLMMRESLVMMMFGKMTARIKRN